MPTSALFNTLQFNESLGDFTEQVIADEVVKYRLEARNKAGELLAYLPYWSNGSVKEILNDAWEISFNYPGLDSNVQYLVYPNQIWLSDQYGNTVQKFIILPYQIQMSSSSYIYSVTASSLLSQLKEEIVVDVEYTEADNASISTIVSNLLNNHQVSDLPIVFGSIDTAIGTLKRAIDIKGQSIFDAIQQLFDSCQLGTFYVDADRRFYWKNRTGEHKGQQIRLGKNLTGLTVRTDASKIVNRIYVYGSGIKNLRSAGLPNQYLDDTASIALYGIKQRVVTLTDVSSPKMLLDYATAVLARFSAPFKSYEIDSIALEQVNPARWSFEHIQLGSSIRVINEDLTVDFTETVVSIERSLDNPINQKITLANKVPSFPEVMGNISKRVNRLERGKGNTPISEETPTPISSVASAGTSPEAAASDHTHDLRVDDDGTSHPLLPRVIVADTPTARDNSRPEKVEKFKTGDTWVSKGSHVVGVCVDDEDNEWVQIYPATSSSFDPSDFQYIASQIVSDPEALSTLNYALDIPDMADYTSTTTPIASGGEGTGPQAGNTGTFSDSGHSHPRYPFGARIFKGATTSNLTLDTYEAIKKGDFAFTDEGPLGWLYIRNKSSNGYATVPILMSYSVFPDIPTKPTTIQCKGQLWYAEPGYTKWAAMVRLTLADGTPGS